MRWLSASRAASKLAGSLPLPRHISDGPQRDDLVVTACDWDMARTLRLFSGFITAGHRARDIHRLTLEV